MGLYSIIKNQSCGVLNLEEFIMFEKFFDYLGFATPFIVFFYLILLEKLKSNKK
jgi:hypothetical protein